MIGNRSIGKVAFGVEHRQPGIDGRAVDSHIADPEQGPDGAGCVDCCKP